MVVKVHHHHRQWWWWWWWSSRACCFLLAHLYIYYLSARENSKRSVKQRKERKKKNFEFLVKKIHSRQKSFVLLFEQKRFFHISSHGAKEDKEDISRARRDVCENCARCSFLPSRRGEDLDRRVVRPHARDAHNTRARVYKKRALVSNYVFCFGKSLKR